MFPTLFKVQDISLSSYFTLIAIGYIVAFVLTKREARRIGVDPEDQVDIALYGLIFGVLGARLLHVVADGFFWDYVHLCTDPFLVEGRDLLGRPLSELQELKMTGRLCTEDAQCLASQEKGRDVGALCQESTGLCHPEQDCFRWLMFWAGGLTFYGAIIAATASGAYYMAKHRVGMLWAPRPADLPNSIKGLNKIPVIGHLAHLTRYLYRFPQGFLKVADYCMPTVVLAHAFGRIGCFLAGCCFGQQTDHAIGVQFPGGSPAYQLHRKENLSAILEQTKALGEHLSLAVHPTQLYSAVLNMGLFFVLWFWVRKRKRFHGQLLATTLILYGVIRFSVEFFRADYRGEWLGLSTSQWISVPLIIIAIVMLVRGFSRSTGLIDDGATPPLGRPLTETMCQPETVTWDGEVVTPAKDWPASFYKLTGTSSQVSPEETSTSEAGMDAPPTDDNNAQDEQR